MDAKTRAKAMPTAPRRFVRPWQAIEHDAHFEVTDATGLHLATVYFEDEPSRQPMLKRLSKDEARRLAHKIARLPALLRIEKGIDPGEA
jgi:hypothetical protein